MIWIDPDKELPPQGKKVLWFKNGDCHVAQRFGKCWAAIPFTDARLAHFDPPDLWCDIYLPGTYEGFMRVMVDEVLLTIDEMEKYHPFEYKLFVKQMIKMIRDSKKK